MEGMTSEQRELVQRILVSRHFAFADSLKRILEYLCEHASGPEAQPLKEYEIAVEALRRPKTFDPKTDPIVRVSIGSIRERLRAYFEQDGRGERVGLSVPKGRYAAIFAEREPVPATPSDRPALRWFWAPYGAAGASNVVTYTEPLFFRDDERGIYVRNIYVNDREVDLAEARPRLFVRDELALRPSFHYLSSGEIQGAIALSRLFAELGLLLDMRNVRLLSVNDVRHANLILLGSVRTSHLVDALMGGGGFRMTATTLESPDPRPGEERIYKGTRYLDGKLHRARDYVLVVRRPGLAPGRTITVVASHHGRAVQGVANMLTLEAQLAGLLEAAGLRLSAPAPAHFQLLLEAEMIDFDDEMVSARYLTHRILDEGGG